MYNNNLSLDLLNIQSYLNLNTNYTIKALTSFLKKEYIYNELSISVLASFNSSVQISNNQLIIPDLIISELKKITQIKNDIDSLRWVFLEYKNDIEMFEIMANTENNLIYETLSTPDFKLYYPEPYIASPSFIHEDF